jgi:predicted SAM-dependent methyltransferase
MENKLKIHLGCGKRNFGPEWVHIDGGDYAHIVSKDIINLDYPDNSVDVIYASHVIAYFDRQEIIPILMGWHRKLKLGGILRLATPDFGAMVMLYQNQGHVLDSFLGPLYGKMPMGNQTIYHKTVYDFMGLKSLLGQIGFTKVQNYDWQNTDHAQFDDHSQAYVPHMDKENGILISLNVEATK